MNNYENREDRLDVYDGIREIRAGLRDAKRSAQNFEDGMKDTCEAILNVEAGLKELKDSMHEYEDGLKELRTGICEIEEGLNDVIDGLKERCNPDKYVCVRYDPLNRRRCACGDFEV